MDWSAARLLSVSEQTVLHSLLLPPRLAVMIRERERWQLLSSASLAQPSQAQPSASLPSPAQPSLAQPNLVQPSPAQPSSTQPS